MKKNKHTNGKEHFDILYNKELEQEVQWLTLGASEKVNSIELLLGKIGLKPNSILELGCGTGAVIKECQKRNLASNYFGIDNSKKAIEYLKANSTNINLEIADITKINPHATKTFDVIVLSHVIEHIEQDYAFLNTLTNFNFKYLVIEVPLEDLFFSKIKSFFLNRKNNAAGHVNFYNVDKFEKLIKSSNLLITQRRKYVPILNQTTIDFLVSRHNMNKLQIFIKKMTQHYLPFIFKKLWMEFYYSHYAVLCINKNIDK